MVRCGQVAEFGELAEGRGKRVEVDGEKILLVRDDDTVRAYAAECPHAGGPLEEGAVCDGRIVCPWHKGAFRVSDGALLEPPPLFALARYPVRVDERGAVFVSPEKIPPEPPPMAGPRTRAPWSSSARARRGRPPPRRCGSSASAGR